MGTGQNTKPCSFPVHLESILALIDACALRFGEQFEKTQTDHQREKMEGKEESGDYRNRNRTCMHNRTHATPDGGTTRLAHSS